MKSLVVPKINDISTNCISDFKEQFKPLPANAIDIAPWLLDFPYKPIVSFQIAHSDEHLFLHYRVQENFLRAVAFEHNQNVWEDSCVECFLSFDNCLSYYNIEFNILGTGLIGYGTADRKLRNRLANDTIATVKTHTEINTYGEKKEWSILLQIPKKIFGIKDWSGKTYHANFYKCGDKLPQPHFLAWNTIENEKPSFHQPNYFGEIIFE